MPFYDKGDVCIYYEEVGAGFPLLVRLMLDSGVLHILYRA